MQSYDVPLPCLLGCTHVYKLVCDRRGKLGVITKAYEVLLRLRGTGCPRDSMGYITLALS